MGVRETWRQIFKMCIKVTGSEATNAYKDDHICVGLRIVIDGVVHVFQSIWGANSTK